MMREFLHIQPKNNATALANKYEKCITVIMNI